MYDEDDLSYIQDFNLLMCRFCIYLNLINIIYYNLFVHFQVEILYILILGGGPLLAFELSSRKTNRIIEHVLCLRTSWNIVFFYLFVFTSIQNKVLTIYILFPWYMCFFFVIEKRFHFEKSNYDI